jgi:spermidine/putrescine transport system ATP-binding protein
MDEIMESIGLTEKHVALDRVSKAYKDIKAVKEISLSIDKGEFIFLIGPSGSGKTTTLRCIAGLENPTSGAIYVNGKRMDTVPPHKRDMAMVWQEYVLFPHLNVGENIEFGLKMRKIAPNERKERVLKALKIVGLSVPLNRAVTQLSGGERQRVGLARALVTNPQVLLLDEPLASLDRNLRLSMQNELKRIHKELMATFIYVTHNQSEALAMADRIVVMNKGIIEQVGTPSELFEFPQTRFVAEFVGDNNIFEGKVISSEGTGKVTIECGKHVFVLNSDENPPPVNSKIAFIVRADKLQIASQKDLTSQPQNALSGKIVAREYVGTIVKYTLKSDEGASLNSIQPVGGYHGSGDDVVIWWQASDTHILPPQKS